MIQNLLTTAFRNLKRNKFFSFLNILGLAVGMAVFLLIAQYVHFEHSYENFVPGKENIYRVALTFYRHNEIYEASAENYPTVGPALKKELPGVIRFARLYNMGYKNNVIITNENAKPDKISFKQRRFLYADSGFLPMMGYEMIQGNAATALRDPNTVVISEKYAKMYFGNEDPIGKTLHMQDDDFNDELAKVTGVFKSQPLNTHLKFDVLFSYQTLYARRGGPKRYDQSWMRWDMYTYVQLQPGTDIRKLQAGMQGIVNRNKPELKASNEAAVLSLQPLADIHLNSDLANEAEPNGNANIVFFITLIGVFVLVIAWINYVNLSTARAIGRAKEVGVRKVIGAYKHQLILQFLAESALVNLISIGIAFLLISIVLPWFNKISGLSLDISYLYRPWFLMLIAGLWIVGTVLSGIYPAWVLSSFKPVHVLKGKLKSTAGGILLRKGLVVTQFMASIALIAGTFIIYRQLGYMMNQSLGVNISQVMVMDRPGLSPVPVKSRADRSTYETAIDHFKDELKKDPLVEGVTLSASVPGHQRAFKVTIRRFDGSTADSTVVRINSMDYDFKDLFQMKILAGRNFAKDFPADPDTSVIVTESATRLLGFKKPEDAVGKTIVMTEFGGATSIIVGVVNDYHQVSLKKAIEPTIFFCSPHDGEYYSVRMKTANIATTVKHVEQVWTKSFPGNPFEYFFLDDYFNQQYKNERRFGELFTTFAVLAIIISCLGLFGLSAFTASQRIREIGIRKVLGASVQDITAMLSKDFLKLVCISILIASPITWIIMNTWLKDFAYRIQISWWIFVVAGVSALLIALLTVSFQAIKAALANPIKSLRTE